MKINKADKWFSVMIRLRDADDNGYCKCVTCNTVLFWKSMQIGHYVKRQHAGARFHECNNHAQCVPCNYGKQGNDAEYKKVIIEKYGQQTHDLLKFAEHHTTKHSKLELLIMAQDFERRAKELAKSKGLTIY
jgi:hypothetical protein